VLSCLKYFNHQRSKKNNNLILLKQIDRRNWDVGLKIRAREVWRRTNGNNNDNNNDNENDNENNNAGFKA